MPMNARDAQAISNLKRQMRSVEMDDETKKTADWQGGYDEMVSDARLAIAALEGEVNHWSVYAAGRNREIAQQEDRLAQCSRIILFMGAALILTSGTGIIVSVFGLI